MSSVSEISNFNVESVHSFRRVIYRLQPLFVPLTRYLSNAEDNVSWFRTVRVIDSVLFIFLFIYSFGFIYFSRKSERLTSLACSALFAKFRFGRVVGNLVWFRRLLIFRSSTSLNFITFDEIFTCVLRRSPFFAENAKRPGNFGPSVKKGTETFDANALRYEISFLWWNGAFGFNICEI